MDHRLMVTLNVNELASKWIEEQCDRTGLTIPEVVEELIYEKMRERRDPSAPTETP